MKIIKLSVLVAAIFSSFSIQAQDPSQSVFVNGTPKGMLGSPVSITVGYDVTDADATLTGLGLRVHYNSSALEFVEFANVLTTDNISSDGSSDDVDDLDGDASTDKFITANWASLFGSWPGSLPSDLLTATFNVADDDSLESTVINFSAASNAAGYLFTPSSYTLDIIGGSWDFDGDGTVDALTDGLLMLRHSFNLRGNGLIDGAVATASTLTHEQVEANLTAAYQIADIDDNGAVDALTDGLMLLRYMFNLRGDALVDQTVAQDAVRTTYAEIEQYIGSFMPSDDSGDTGSGDTGSGDTGSGDTGSGDTGSGDTGSGDTGSGDTGSGDTGSGDTGSGDTGSGTEKGPAQFTEAFGGTTFDGELFTFPAAAESWAGFANMDLELYPFVFSGGGSISFTAAVPSGGSTDVKFRFEKNPHPDVDPSYDTSTVTITGATESSYSVNIPSQGNNAFRSFIMYVVDRDVAVQVSNLIVTEVSNSDTGDTGSGDTGDNGSGTPNQPADGVISIFGDTYTNVNVTDFNPYWEQQTQVTVGDVLTYANLNYQGTEFEAQDVSTKEFFHVDFYTDNASALEMFVINSPGAETGYSLTNQIVLGQWVSVDIPLSAYDVVDLRAVNQLKVVGDGTVKFDNLYFHGSTAASLPKNVTFSVNMSGIDLLGEVPTIQGTFNGWCGACNPMSDPDGDDIWSLTIELPEATYEYKYALGNWVSQENVPLNCVNSVGANRSFTINGVTVLATDAYNGCPGEAPTLGGNITFSVDMTGVDLGGEVPTLQGGFNNWCGGCAPLSDDNGDNVWTITTNLAGGEHQYKYALGAWVSSETVPANCAHTIVANRSLNVTGDATNPTDVYNACPSDFTGVTDPGTGTGGDTGGDTGGTDPVYTPADGFVITEAFGGTTIGDGTLLTFPAGAEVWAGFANMNTSLYPISLSQASIITFTAAIPAGGSADVRFRFEKNPHPDVDPAFDTASVTVIGDQATSYSISVPSQGNNTFRSFIVYLDTRDVAVEISDIVISVDSDGDTGTGDTGSGDTGSGDTGSGDTGSGDTGSGDTGSGDTGSGDTGSGDTGSGNDDFVTETVGPASFIEAFGGTTIQGDEFTHPSSAEPWAGIANMDASLYPLSFADGGSISFTGAVPSGGSVNVQFKFEFNSHPDTEPSYSTAFTTISGSADQAYTVQIPSQGNKTFSNLIFYIQERNTAVKIADLMITTTTDPDAGNGVDAPDDYNTLSYGAGSIGDAIYPSNHRCKSDYGYWVENAGVISTSSAVQALGCNQSTGIPTGNITKLYPQLTGPAAQKPTQTHKWWGSIPFLGEMTVDDPNDSAYITPDPMSARISNMGVRVGSIPSGIELKSLPFANSGQYYYPIPGHQFEVFDGIAVGNSAYSDLEAFAKDHSEGSVTVLWKSGSTDVMEATFVHGSPYVYIKAYVGDIEVRTLRQDGVGEKGTFSTPSNMLGIWTNVAGKTNNFLIVGEGSTSFPDLSDNADPMTMGTNGVINSAKEMTLVYLPQLTPGSVSSAMIDQFASVARNKVAAVNIDYSVDRSNNEITVTHTYVDDQGASVDTLAGLHPLHWKNTSQATTPYQIRSARGMIKFAELSQFSYQIPYVGVLPTLPSIDGSFNQATLAGLVTDFVNQGSNVWNTSAEGDLYEDTYWSGKNYGKVAEVSAIARSIGMTAEANDMIDWLKAELSDWFSSEADGALKTKKYFVYDSDWNTLLGFDEAYGSHQRLADHHFHYGYFVRAAAEICRVDLAWCGEDQYGPMIELLIRDYAADKDDPMFPHMRNFDPANGFSWADGQMNFIRGNNNESTSEAATAYGAIILYGLATGNTELTEKGMYLHASTGAAYWEYWNNIDGYNNVSAEADNFFPGYGLITTSIIWGDGVDFATWFSPAYAHILGIQGLPSSPLIFHVGLHADYMEDYVNLGLSESSNGKPSGLIDDQWRDLWWNLWAMTDSQAAIADYNSVSSYDPEQGESKAHTYHWIHTFDELGHLATGTGDITANHPAAIAFDKNGVKSYVVYNFTDQTIPVTFKQGNTVIHTMNATPFGFTVE